MKPFEKSALLLAVCFMICSLWFITSSFAAIPKLIGYQGKLTDSQGVPLNGTYNITLRIYDTEAGGSALWTETHSGLTIQRGIYNLMIGGVTALNLPFDKQYWLSVQIGGDPEMTPRTRLASIGYSFRSENADNAAYAASAGVANTAITAPARSQMFTSNGSFTTPQGVTMVYLTMCGGGGGGGGGGGAGPSGSGNRDPTAGGNGGNTSFDSSIIALGGVANAGQGGISTATGGFAGGNGPSGGWGAGGSGYSSGRGGDGGASGAVYIRKPYPVVPGNNYVVVIGTGGTGAAGKGAGGNSSPGNFDGGGNGGTGAGGYYGTGGASGPGGAPGNTGGDATGYGAGGGGGGGGSFIAGVASGGGAGRNGSAGFILVEW